jgi:uncharacterized protein YbcI
MFARRPSHSQPNMEALGGDPPAGDPPEDVRGDPIAGEVLARISTQLVQLHSRYYGKGPTKAKTYAVNDTVICILKGGFTTVERTLIDQGKAEAVHEVRRSFQAAMEDQFTRVVEDATGRKVIAYMSQVHHDPDLAVELFVLEPIGTPVVGEYELDLSRGD